MRADTADYRELFLSDLPLLDTRSPVEFRRGAFPNATNIPLMTDAERHEVGICYKQSGQSAAIELGHSLVSGDERERRIASWRAFAESHSQGFLYCFRGGLRSSTVQQWMRDAGVEYPLVKGGYKAMRGFLLEQLVENLHAMPPVLIAGRTGSGKTRVIAALASSIDLEGIANHRGSSFGRLLDPQPAQIDFENALSIDILRTRTKGLSRLVMEDEGKLIGRVSLPLPLRQAMAAAPLLVVEESIDSRVEVIYEDYVLDLGARYQQRYGEQGGVQHIQHLREGLARIRKRLGGDRFQYIDTLLQRAFSSADSELHKEWIADLLVKYYDPMYDYQFAKREGEVVFQGDRDAVIAFADSRYSQSRDIA